MKQVSNVEFFKAIGSLNVHPRADLTTFKGRYHTSHWETQDTRIVIGKTESDSHAVEPTRFFLTGAQP